jgi:hypothetical protein
MKSFVTHYFVLSKDGALRKHVWRVCSDNCQNVVFKTIIMVEITDSRILQHVENRTHM